MTPWSIHSVELDGWNGPHPCVIISAPKRSAGQGAIEVLGCSSHRSHRPPEAHEVLLDQSDGLDWQTLCKCDLIYAVESRKLGPQRGMVTQSRRAAIVRTIIASHHWSAVL